MTFGKRLGDKQLTNKNNHHFCTLLMLRQYLSLVDRLKELREYLLYIKGVMNCFGGPFIF